MKTADIEVGGNYGNRRGAIRKVTAIANGRAYYTVIETSRAERPAEPGVGESRSMLVAEFARWANTRH